MCEISTANEEEKVAQVSWYLGQELVYEWFQNETINVYGALEERVELPSNRTDNWNIKINRIAYELQGEFKCDASNTDGQSSFKTFDFILFYNEGAEYEVLASPSTDCDLQVELKMPALYPRPIVLLCKMYSNDGFESAVIRGFNSTKNNPDGSYNYYFNASIWVGDYPFSSFLNCTDYVYGTKIEVFSYQPVEEMPTCRGELPETLNQSFLLDRAVSTFIPGCRNDLRKGSEAKYRCAQDTTVLFSSTCSQDGQWQPDLFSLQINDLPKCGCSIISGSILWLVLFAMFTINL
ncbi:uncharacterized protein LOC135945856 [Cloeon dipterum]|uniref:uncharacterized protein LOC135945856 n=1 Tax=Cloeon dipterum TaxID=197152 RepID=UPI0032201983